MPTFEEREQEIVKEMLNERERTKARLENPWWFLNDDSSETVQQIAVFLGMPPDTSREAVRDELKKQAKGLPENGQDQEAFFFRLYDAIKKTVETPDGLPPVVGYVQAIICTALGIDGETWDNSPEVASRRAFAEAINAEILAADDDTWEDGN